MTTNDISRLQPGQAALTILTSPVARIDAVFSVLCRQDDLLLLPSEGQADALRQRLQGQIFFMDKVTVTDESAQLRRLRLLGPAAGDLLLAAGLPQPASDDHFLEEAGVSVLRQERFDLPGYEIIGAVETLDALQERLISAGAVPLADSVSYEARRIELGRPRPGQELTDAFTPLEAGMAWVCAENKGCYTGQEIIARQLTYDKVTRALVRLRAELPLLEGASVSVNDRAVGTVTSSGYSPTAGSVALAVLKRLHNVEGVEVTVEGAAARVEQILPPGS
jgi:folate-binding protein YgfZ